MSCGVEVLSTVVNAARLQMPLRYFPLSQLQRAADVACDGFVDRCTTGCWAGGLSQATRALVLGMIVFLAYFAIGSRSPALHLAPAACVVSTRSVCRMRLGQLLGPCKCISAVQQLAACPCALY